MQEQSRSVSSDDRFGKYLEALASGAPLDLAATIALDDSPPDCLAGCTCEECVEYDRYIAAGHPEISTDEQHRYAVASGLLAV